MNSTFSDAELRQAATLVRQSMLESLPHPTECHYDISPEMEQKIDRLLKREDQKKHLRRLGQMAASILLAFLVGVGAWLAVDTEARAAVVRWVKEVYEESVFYRFFNESTSKAMPYYRLTSLPGDYTETVAYEDESLRVLMYENGTDIIIFTCQRMVSSNAAEMYSNSYSLEQVPLNNFVAELYVPFDPTSTSDLVWIDDNQSLFFCLSSFAEKDVIIDIAKGVQLVETPN